jgi:predicted nuclease of predicted toxin-antitoxin system
VKFLLDENLSERLAELLRDAGHDAVHVKPLGLSTAPDTTILARAAEESRVLISGDTDFGALVAVGHRREPSVILYRRERPRRPEAQATLLLAYLDRVAAALEDGAIVVIEETRIRVRELPIVPEEV